MISRNRANFNDLSKAIISPKIAKNGKNNQNSVAITPSPYIVTDLDNTLIDTYCRTMLCLLLINRQDLINKQNPINGLTKQEKQIFLKNFDLRFAELDTINYNIVRKVSQLQKATQLPVLVLTGRNEHLLKEVTLEKIRVLNRYLIIQRFIMRKTFEISVCDFKVQQLEKENIVPVYLFDDDIEVQKAIKKRFKNVKIQPIE